MTRLDALSELNLADNASREDVEQADRRLVRRFPPEFNPAKFQKRDDAYRFLTSLPDMVERLLSPTAGSGITLSDFQLSVALPPNAVDKALASLSRQAKMAELWPTGQPAGRK